MHWVQWKCRITEEASIKFLQRYRVYIVHLNLRSCFGIGANSFRAAAECKNLQDLNLSNCSQLTVIFYAIHAFQLWLYLSVTCLCPISSLISDHSSVRFLKICEFFPLTATGRNAAAYSSAVSNASLPESLPDCDRRCCHSKYRFVCLF